MDYETSLKIIAFIIAIYLLGKYAIEEGQRVERQKEFEKNLENWDKNGRKRLGKKIIDLPIRFY